MEFPLDTKDYQPDILVTQLNLMLNNLLADYVNGKKPKVKGLLENKSNL